MRIHEHLLDFFMTLIALSSLALWGVVVSGGSFNTYAVLLLSIPLLSGYLVMINNRGRIPDAPVENITEHRENGTGVLSLLIFALVLIIFFVESNLITVSLLLVVLLMLMQQSKIRPKTLNHYSFVEGSPYVLCVAILIAVSYTLASHRPTADDALYLFFGLLPLDQLQQALIILPQYNTGRLLVSYPIIEAVISYWTGIDYLQVYYLLIPALAAMLSALAYHGLFQRINRGYAELLTLMSIIILILWADESRSPGNFAFATLGIGKAMFFTVVCPYLVSSAMGVLTRRPGSSFRLAMASISGIGLTQSAIVLVPLFFTGLILATWLVYRESPISARSLPFLAGLAGLILLIAGIVAYLGEIPGALNPRDYSLREALDVVFGDGLRGPFGIASIALLPLLAQDRARHKAIISIIVALMLTALNPVIVFLVGQIVWSLTWRLQWLLLPAATAATGIFLVAHFIARGKPHLRLVLCVAGLIGFALLGQTTFSTSNGNRLGIPQIKPPPTINGVFERHHIGKYKLPVEYRLENGRVCMVNGCY